MGDDFVFGWHGMGWEDEWHDWGDGLFDGLIRAIRRGLPPYFSRLPHVYNVPIITNIAKLFSGPECDVVLM